jgi:hypothetical protein
MLEEALGNAWGFQSIQQKVGYGWRAGSCMAASKAVLIFVLHEFSGGNPPKYL